MFENIDNLETANGYKLQCGNKDIFLAIIVPETLFIFQGERVLHKHGKNGNGSMFENSDNLQFVNDQIRVP